MTARADELGLRLSAYSDAMPSNSPWAAANPSLNAPLVVCVLLSALAVGIFGALVVRLQAARRALVRETNRYEQLAEQTSDVVLRISGARAMVSSSIEALTGYSAAEMQALGMAALVHPDDLARVVDAYKDVGPDTLRRIITYRLLHKDGSIVWVEATFGWLGSADGGETIVTIRDITKRQIEAEALQGAIQAARAAREASEAANKAKGDFLASMSHEIRTPLNAIIGFAELQIAMPDLPAAARRHAERVKGGGAALLVIVNDILDFAQAETGRLRLDPRPFALPLLVDECIALVENAAVAKRLALNIELVDRFPTGLLGDEARLRQILLNLLNNAIKFTARGSVTLRIGYDRTVAGHRVFFAVTDTGIGIDEAHLPHLFQRFHQVDGTIRRNYGGTGLGLAISKMLVELMGGSIDVVSKKDVGSTFTISLDLAPAPLFFEADDRRDQPLTPLSILLVEDMPINQELACAVLEAKGHVVDVVGDGAEAIMAVDTFAYDLVLMDVQMPFVDGLTATRAIRDLPSAHRFVPIVAMTANVMKAQTIAAIEAGMDAILAKPLSIDAVQTMLTKVGHGTLRADPSAALDQMVFTRLVDVIGDARAETMLQTLAKGLSERFTQACSAATLPALKAEAHASATAAATLGFLPFAAACRRFVAATDETVEDAYRALRREHARTVTMAQRLATVPPPEERQAA